VRGLLLVKSTNNLSKKNLSKTLKLRLRYAGEGIVVVQGSNDALADSYGTVIPVEVLMRDWLPGFMAHRTISSQHALELRGVAGDPQVGMATRVDFAPQLEVTVRVDDAITRGLLEDGTLTGASLEFVPIAQRTEVRDGVETIIFERFSSEPEHCGLSLVDIPSVSGADILEMRSTLPNWAFAVVDPKVLNGEITDPKLIQQLRWYPHHNPITHAVEPLLAQRAANNLSGITVPREASLTREQIMSRGKQHLDRHNVGVMEARMDKNQYIQMRTAQGITAEAAATEWDAAATQSTAPVVQPDTRAAAAQPIMTMRFEGLHPPQPVQPVLANVAQPAAAPVITPELEALIQARVAAVVEPAMAAMNNRQVANSGRKLEGDELLGEVMLRSVIPQMMRRSPTSEERQEIDNILTSQGIATRALTIEGNGTIIYNELARQFVIKPQVDIIGRNHWMTIPMVGVNKRDFPRFDAGALDAGVQWNRSSAVGAGSTTAITPADPTLDTFSLEVTELNAACVVPDSFSFFNAQGTNFISSVLLPAMRSAAMRAEDLAFFRSSGVHPNPKSFRGLKNMLGATVIAASTNGDAFTQDLLETLLRAMPVRFRGDNSKLAFYIAVPRGDDWSAFLRARQTTGGDAWMQNFANNPGPKPIGVFNGIAIYTVPQEPTNEVQGSATNASTAYLVHKDIPVVGDAVSLRIEPYRMEGFVDKLQLQQFVGLGYQFPEAIVRRAGILPKV
jgi:hypothetical protein